MILIVESGATKSDWRAISRDGKEMKKVIAEGVNVSTMKMETAKAIISETAALFTSFAISDIYFYTAGVVTPDIESDLISALKSAFPEADCEIQNDLTAAARAACGPHAGIAAILGTGSNSCLFDGEKIVGRVYSGGFILGDEGSAATLGKLFIADFLKGLVPEEVAADFAARHDSDYATIVRNIYHNETSPSGYLGSFAPFIMEHYENEYIRKLVDNNFRAFVQRSLKRYDTEHYNVGVVGGFGYALKEIVSRIAEEEGVRISRFIKEPIEGLVAYHLESKKFSV